MEVPVRTLSPAPKGNFRRFFLRGLGVLLPTVLTIWILAVVYQFVDQKIASPINAGIRSLILNYSTWPEADSRHRLVLGRDDIKGELKEWEKDAWAKVPEAHRQDWLNQRARRLTLERKWALVSIGNWAVLDLIGFLIAVVLICSAGLLLGSFIGKKLYKCGEELFYRIPVIKAIYPSVKQVTDFLFGDEAEKKMRFDRVVAVEYPRKGIWSVGLVTGETMRTIQDCAGQACVTVFVPSSPTPFTGYTLTVLESETIELGISIDDAIRFTVSGGVVVPESQLITPRSSAAGEKPALSAPKLTSGQLP